MQKHVSGVRSTPEGAGAFEFLFSVSPRHHPYTEGVLASSCQEIPCAVTNHYAVSNRNVQSLRGRNENIGRWLRFLHVIASDNLHPCWDGELPEQACGCGTAASGCYCYRNLVPSEMPQ